MDSSTRFRLALVAILLVGAIVLWPAMRRMRAINACLDRGDSWDYSTHTCGPHVNAAPLP